MLGLFAVAVLTLRTVLSILFTRRILFFMSRRGALISSDLISKFLSLPLLTIQKWSIQAGIFAVTGGVQIIVLQVLALLVVLISDISLLIILVAGLFIVDPVTALCTIVIFGSVSFALYLFMHVRAGRIGSINARLSIQSSEKVAEVFSFKRPKYNLSFEDKVKSYLEQLSLISETYNLLINNNNLGQIMILFDNNFPNHNLDKTKVFDFLFWSAGKVIRR
jgi:hypothetical protein